METDKRRKRSENDVVRVLPKKPRKEGDDAAATATADVCPPSPREEEVEEFFAILRRMREAMNALSKSNGDAPRFGEKWTMAIEADVVDAINGVNNAETDRKEELFDLNVVPEPETAGR